MSKKFEQQLKPCPYCGGNGRLKVKQGRHYSNMVRHGAIMTADYYIRCEKCHAITPPERKEDVCAAWNRGIVLPAMYKKQNPGHVRQGLSAIIASSKTNMEELYHE